MSVKPNLIYIDDGYSANDIYQKYVNDNDDIYSPGYYKYNKRVITNRSNEFN